MPLFILTILLFVTSAFGQEVPTTPAPETHIEVIRETSKMISSSTMAIVLWCQPTPSAAMTSEEAKLGMQVEYSMDRDPSASFEAQSKAMLAALTPRSDIQTLVWMNNPSAAEITSWLTDQNANLDDQYREVFVTVTCPAVGGPYDEERLLTREVTDAEVGGLSFADFATGVASLGDSTVWLLDASRDLHVVAGTPTFGPTADDFEKLGIKNALAISSSASGKYGSAGLIGVAAKVIEASHGGMMDLKSFYYDGIKVAASTFDLATSMGTPGDGWTDNFTRMIFVGGPLTLPVAEVKPPKAKSSFKLKPSYGVIAGGGASLIASGVLGLQANKDYETLVQYNEFGGESQEELDAAVGSYRTNTRFAVGLGALGVLATAGGITWTVLGSDVTVVPTGNGVTVTGSW